MEKSVPHCKLAVVKTLVEAGKVRTTHAARVGATALGLGAFRHAGRGDGTDTGQDFYKSMTTHADHTVWQDVYRPSTRRVTCT
jgi:motility quorum-sensing regulator/GCU-specific mRNA interferase toxin